MTAPGRAFTRDRVRDIVRALAVSSGGAFSVTDAVEAVRRHPDVFGPDTSYGTCRRRVFKYLREWYDLERVSTHRFRLAAGLAAAGNAVPMRRGRCGRCDGYVERRSGVDAFGPYSELVCVMCGREAQEESLL